MWRLRYPDFPEPDVCIGDLAGWDPGRAEEIGAWASRRPGRGQRTVPAEHVQEVQRRVFVYIDFPGVEYDDDGRLADGMQAKAAAHLADAMRGQGYEIFFNDPATNVTEAMRRILWDRWPEDEIGEHEFTGRLFDDRGQIYRGCTAFDAARYTLQRLAVLGGELRPAHQPLTPEPARDTR
jgi:hypothetical protein